MDTDKGIGDDSATIGGTPVVDPRTGGKDMRLLRRAIKEGWPISPEIRQLVVSQMALVVGRSEEERSKVAAARVLVAADAINAKREAMDTPQKLLHGRMDDDTAEAANQAARDSLVASDIAAARRLMGVADSDISPDGGSQSVDTPHTASKATSIPSANGHH